MTSPLKMTALALPFLVGLSLPAAAGTITNVEIAVSPGKPTNISDYQALTLSGGILKSDTGSNTMDVGISGQIVLSTNAGTLGVWCVDLLHDIYLGGQYTYTTTALTTNNLDGTENTKLTTAQIEGIAQLAAFGNAVLQDQGGVQDTVSTTLNNVYKADLATYEVKNATADAAILTDLPAFSAAIQASIWDLEYGTTATGSADFMADLALISAGKSYFDNVGGYELNISGAQKQFVSDVPEPAPIALLGAGLLGLAFGTARRKANTH